MFLQTIRLFYRVSPPSQFCIVQVVGGGGEDGEVADLEMKGGGRLR